MLSHTHKSISEMTWNAKTATLNMLSPLVLLSLIISASTTRLLEVESGGSCEQHAIDNLAAHSYTETRPNVIPTSCILHLTDENGNDALLGTF